MRPQSAQSFDIIMERRSSASMERYNSSENGTKETYMVLGTHSSLYPAINPSHKEKNNPMGNDAGNKFMVEQGVYYPAVSNYYGYYCTGFEPSAEWEDHYGFFGLDGLDPQYTGVQAESLPYVYYTPSYGYAESPYNPYNPYIPGAVIAVDGPYLGAQQYCSGPVYQLPVYSPGYFPVLVSSAPDVMPNASLDHTVLGSAAAAGAGSIAAGVKHVAQPAPGVMITNPQFMGSHDHTQISPNLIFPSSKLSDMAEANSALNQQPTSCGGATSSQILSSASAHNIQDRSSSRSADRVAFGSVSSLHSPIKVSFPVNKALEFGSSTLGWAPMHNLKDIGADLSGEQNRGPRTNMLRNRFPPAVSVQDVSPKTGVSDAEGKIVIYADQYNKEEFPINYTNAKFFVIKSYSEDDVHKSIKYSVWSSTSAGNRKLDAAYQDAQRMSGGNPGKCPVFLFFSVNASGQFCGVAEMVGPVDFDKDMNFWQQDKWSGSFPVKWHIVKDVPNINFRYVILQNNENKPVTNSRDTQEIWYTPGLQMLNIFKNYASRTSLLDDFCYYEEREKIRQEEKLRMVKSFGSSFFLPAFVPISKQSVTPCQLKANGDLLHQSEANCLAEKLVSGGVQSSLQEDNEVSAVEKKLSSLSMDALEGNANASDSKPVANATTIDVVTVGSLPVKVNGFDGTSEGILTIGSISIDPKSIKA